MPYKVVRPIEGYGLASAIVSVGGVSRRYAVRYSEGTWTRAKAIAEGAGYGLLYFDNLHDTKHFLKGCWSPPELQIWECEIEGDMQLPPRGFGNMQHAIATGYHAWDFRTINWPIGTRMARKIKLTRRVKDV